MGFVEDLTPTQYRLRRLVIQQKDDGSVTATFDVQLLNADGKATSTGETTVTLTSAQVDTLTAFVDNKRAAFEAATGLTPA
jgi:hypothetical protein